MELAFSYSKNTKEEASGWCWWVFNATAHSLTQSEQAPASSLDPLEWGGGQGWNPAAARPGGTVCAVAVGRAGGRGAPRPGPGVWAF